MTFFSSAPLRSRRLRREAVRHPPSAVKELQGKLVPRDAGEKPSPTWWFHFFRSNSAEYELRVQLCTDPVTMPIEDATRGMVGA